MQNPFKELADLVHSGMTALHGRADAAEKGVETIKAELESLKSDFAARLTKIEGMFDIGDALDKLKSTTSSAPALATDPALAVPSSTVATVVSSTEAPAEHVEPAVQAHAEATAAGSPVEVAEADAAAAAISAGASPATAQAIASAVTDAVGAVS